MRALAVKPATEPNSVAQKRARPRLAGEGDNAVQSPVANMHADISSTWTAGEASAAPGFEEARWSARRTVGFVALTCGSFWALVGVAVLHYARP